MDLLTALTWLSIDRFLSGVTPGTSMWSASGIWEPATLTVARLRVAGRPPMGSVEDNLGFVRI